MSEEIQEVIEKIATEGTPPPEAETPQVEYTEDEQRAMEMGWEPSDKFEGDPKTFRSAREFLERGEMIGKIRALTKESTQIKTALQHLTAQNQKIYDKGYQAALSDLKDEKRAALAEGDLVKADEVQEKIDEVKEQQKANKNAPQVKVDSIDPEHQSWVATNQWYDSNPVLRKFADALAIEYVQVNQGQVSASDVRDYVAKTVRQEFAHRFNTKQVVGAPSPDGAGRSTNSKPGNGTNQLSTLKASMSDDDRGIMKTIIKTTGMSEDDYLKQYASVSKR